METSSGLSAGASLLLVEDERLISTVEARLLTSWGHTVKVAETGEAALLALREDPHIDLILMDISLGPGMDGFETADRIGRDHDIPVVFLTSHLDESYLLRARAVGNYYGYIIKNGDEITLRESVSVALRLSRTYRHARDAEDRYRSLFLKSPVATLLLDAESGAIRAANAAACALYGLSEPELMASDIDRLSPDDIDTQALLPDPMAQPAGWSDPTTIIRQYGPGGDIRSMRFGFSRTQTDHQHLVYATLEDVTEQQETREALTASREALRSLVNNAPIGIFRSLSSGAPLEANQAMAEILGCETPAEAIEHYHNLGETLYADAEERASFLRELEQNGAVRHFEYRARRRDDSIIWLRVDARIAGQHPDGSQEIHGFATDITEHKQREDELRRAEEFSRLLAERVPSMVYLYDIPAGRTRWANQPLREALLAGGIPDPQRVSNEEVLSLVHPDDHEPLITYSTHIAEGEEPPQQDLVIRFRFQKDWHWYSLRVLVFEREPAGRPLSMLGILTEVDRLKLEADQARGQLEQSVTTLNETNHRVKNNLVLVSALLAFQESARGIDLSDARHQIDTIARVHEHLLHSEDDGRVSLRDQLREVVHAAVGAGPDIRLELDIADLRVGSREAVTLGLLVNELVTNARKHALGEGGMLRVTVHPTDSGGVWLEVANDGRPMPDSVDLSQPESMGLQLVTTLAEQLGGNLSVERSPLTRISAELRIPTG